MMKWNSDSCAAMTVRPKLRLWCETDFHSMICIYRVVFGECMGQKPVKLDNWDTHKLDGFGVSVSSWTWPKITPDNFHIHRDIRQAALGSTQGQYLHVSYFFWRPYYCLFIISFTFANLSLSILPGGHQSTLSYGMMYTCISRCTPRLVCLHV